jgi:hypothetical protein
VQPPHQRLTMKRTDQTTSNTLVLPKVALPGLLLIEFHYFLHQILCSVLVWTPYKERGTSQSRTSLNHMEAIEKCSLFPPDNEALTKAQHMLRSDFILKGSSRETATLAVKVIKDRYQRALMTGTIVDHVQNRAIQIGANRYIVPAADNIAVPSFGDAVFVSDSKYANCIVLRNPLGVVEMTDYLYEGEPIKLFNPFDGDAEDREKLKWCRKLVEFLFHVQISSLVTGEGALKQWKRLQSAVVDHLATFNTHTELETGLKKHFKVKKFMVSTCRLMRTNLFVRPDLSKLLLCLQNGMVNQVDVRGIVDTFSINLKQVLSDFQVNDHITFELDNTVYLFLSQKPRNLWDTHICGTSHMYEPFFVDMMNTICLEIRTIVNQLSTELLLPNGFIIQDVKCDFDIIIADCEHLLRNSVQQMVETVELKAMYLLRSYNILVHVMDVVNGESLSLLRKNVYTLGSSVSLNAIVFPLNVLFFKSVRESFAFLSNQCFQESIFTVDFVARFSSFNETGLYWIPNRNTIGLGHYSVHQQYLKSWSYSLHSDLSDDNSSEDDDDDDDDDDDGDDDKNEDEDEGKAEEK